MPELTGIADYCYHRPVMLRLFLFAAAATLAAAVVLTRTAPSQAHNWDNCGNGLTASYIGGSSLITWPSTWMNEWQTALENARVEFNVSHFVYYRGAGETTWADLGSPDTSIAGLARITSEDCNGTALIYSVDLFINTPHFQASPHTVGQRQCTAIHEMGHLVGLNHNDLVSIETTPHEHRCHYWEVKKLQSHDISDINYRY